MKGEKIKMTIKKESKKNQKYNYEEFITKFYPDSITMVAEPRNAPFIAGRQMAEEALEQLKRELTENLKKLDS
jgi:4'-phosphopantetheinyl transferase EntD